MIVQIHGGPFADSLFHAYTAEKVRFLLQGFCLLIVNYRGSIGYGEDCMNSLLRNISVNDV